MSDRLARAIIMGCMVSLGAIAIREIKEAERLRNAAYTYHTMWKLTEEEFNAAFKRLDPDDREAVRAQFEANHAYLKVLFKTTKPRI